VSVDPGSYRRGAPQGRGRHRRLKPTERPLAPMVDAWLADWTPGWSGAGSVMLEADTPEIRRQVSNTWATEKRARGWRAEHVSGRFVVEGRQTRFYWWSPGSEPPPRDPPTDEGEESGT